MRHLPKQILLFGICMLLRLIPFRPANAEPLMSTLMPFATKFGQVANLIWIVASIALYDFFTAGIGHWTWEAAFAYGLVSIAATVYFKKANPTRGNFVGFALVATLFFDILTGLVFTPLFSQISFSQAFAGQVPFTLAHLASNFLLAAFLSPVIQKWVVENKALELEPIIQKRLA